MTLSFLLDAWQTQGEGLAAKNCHSALWWSFMTMYVHIATFNHTLWTTIRINTGLSGDRFTDISIFLY